ncbi:MAG: SDR family oxidoreductase [Chloroflexota bacterium]|nr:SDR family oxidoreductase [Chloroflexota bacterium]
MSPSQRYVPLNDLISLTGRGAIVTGAAVGIGFAISYRLAEAGASVAVVDQDGEGAERASDELRRLGYQAHHVACDVSREDDVEDMVRSAAGLLGHIDILVNNAGVYPRAPLGATSGDDFEQVLAVNLKGTFLCGREASRHMIEARRGGCIINIASIDAVHPSSKGLTAYDASKGGVLSLTKSMALELGQHDIRVNAIAPGGVLTESMLSHVTGSETAQGRSELKKFMARMALGRMGEADDVGRAALFLASDLASYMTGSLVVVDGGYLIS